MRSSVSSSWARSRRGFPWQQFASANASNSRHAMNKSGTAGQVITHPTGGGAIKGLGDTFAPDLHTGTGNLSVPIAVPSGRAGLQPDLTLVYSTGQGSGAFGLGWGLSIPGVSRDTARQIPTYDDEQDVFLLSGA